MHARIQIHLGKIQIWNQGGEKPPGCDALTTGAQRFDPNAVVWKGDRTLPQDQQGLIVLGTPLRSAEFVQREFAELSVKHQSLLDRIPQVQDLQSAWLLLLFCNVRMSNYFLRMLHPEVTRVFAVQHDSSVKRCLEQVLHTTIPDATWPVAPLPLALGGLGLRSASRCRQVSSSWADVLHGNEWQTQDANGFFLTTAVWPRLSDTSRALLKSQGGPLAGLLFSFWPSSFHTRFAPQVFQVLFLRHMWLPLPLTKRICGCGRLLDSFGHHRAACANVGVLGREVSLLQLACREAGGRLSVNQYVHDLDIATTNAADNRRLEVVADARRAVHARGADTDGAATMAARRRKQQRYPELAGGPCV